VLDALRQAGVTHFDIPATPERIWRTIQAPKSGNPRAVAALGTTMLLPQIS